MSQLLSNIDFARQYMLLLLKDLQEDDWYRMPSEGVTNIAWQGAHLACAEYQLVFARVAGREKAPPGILPESFLAQFGRGSTPGRERSAYPSSSEILHGMDAVHQAARTIIPTLDDATLDEPSDPPHPAFRDKAGALRWCAQHEFVHAGQIALLRRLLGYAPLR